MMMMMTTTGRDDDNHSNGQHVPNKYQNNILYARPDDQVMSLVKVERSERSTFRAQLKKTKLDGMKARLESIAYLDDDGNVDVRTGDSDGDERDI